MIQANPSAIPGATIKNKRILVTGGAGFIGTALAERLVGSNDVTLMDVGFDHNSIAFSELKADNRVKLAEVDILDIEKVASVAKDAQIVVHAAAVLGVQEVVYNSSRTLDVNYIGTSNLLRILSDSTSCERVILLSSSEVLGSNAFRIAEDGDCVLPSIQDPRWCYANRKRSLTGWTRWARVEALDPRRNVALTAYCLPGLPRPRIPQYVLPGRRATNGDKGLHRHGRTPVSC